MYETDPAAYVEEYHTWFTTSEAHEKRIKPKGNGTPCTNYIAINIYNYSTLIMLGCKFTIAAQTLTMELT